MYNGYNQFNGDLYVKYNVIPCLITRWRSYSTSEQVILQILVFWVQDQTIGEILVFHLPICFFYYLAKLVIFIRSSRIPCIFS